MSISFIPGTANVAPEVLAAQARPVIPHFSKEFEELYHSTAEKLKRLFFTVNPVYLVPGTGTGMLEAFVRNFADVSMLACVNGAFSSRWSEIAEANGKRAVKLEVLHNEAITPDILADALEGRLYDAVTIVHNETASGIVNPIKDLAGVVKDISPDTLILVDAVSSLGGIEIKMDEWGIDGLLTVSYNCLALPPGLVFAAVSEVALERAGKIPDRGWFTDLLRWEKHRMEDSTPVMPNVTLTYALDTQLDRIFAEGIDKRFARHAEIAARVQEWAKEIEMPPFAPEEARSNTVTALLNTKFFDFEDLDKFLVDRGMRVGRGYGILREKTFRIGHMGDIRMSDIDILLSALEEFLA